MKTYNIKINRVVDESYDVKIGYGLLRDVVNDIKEGLIDGVSKYAIITDDIVEKLYGEKLLCLLKDNGYFAEIFSFTHGEKNKIRKTKEDIEDLMLTKGFRRDSCIIAIGGGVVTDLAGFIAATFCRGIPIINYATTLLAAADASVGGKNAVDTNLATNLIGTIYQPQRVYIDIETWKTLNRREIASGLAETVKHACVADYVFFEYLEKNIDNIFALDCKTCEYVAERNCKIKYEIVAEDSRELGLREILNLGHTVGRAIEQLSEYKLLHGEAISIGLVCEVELAYEYGYMNAEEKNRVINLLSNIGLPTSIPDYINKTKLVDKLYTDKKVKNNRIRFVLQKHIGGVVEFEEGVYSIYIDEKIVAEVIQRI